MSASVFISFASQDRKVAMALCQALEGRGMECWISARDIQPGENFQSAIVRAIRQCKVMLLVFTANSNNSEEMNKELALASQNKLMVVPLRIEDVAPNDAFAYEFATRQWIDFFTDWDFAVTQLSQRIERAVGIEPNPGLQPVVEAPSLSPAPEAKIEPAKAEAPKVEVAAPVKIEPAQAAKPAPAAKPTPVTDDPKAPARAAAPPKPVGTTPKPATDPAGPKPNRTGLFVAIGAAAALAAAAVIVPGLLGKKPKAQPTAEMASTQAAPAGLQTASVTPATRAVAPTAMSAEAAVGGPAATDASRTEAPVAEAPKKKVKKPKAAAAVVRHEETDVPY